ncbi:MAG: BamA/TamA family outer membrane protein, partial [Bacteroidota bacterium]|nr:BamA/TamA family outer membrane protein [Bacteroidota bacterium]
MYKNLTGLFFLLFLSFTGWAQQEVTLKINASQKDREILRKYVYPSRFADTLAARQGIRSLMQQLQNDGYLTASIDTFYYQQGVLQSELFIGEKYRWARLRSGNVEDNLLIQAGYKEKLYTGKPFLPGDWVKLQEAVLTQAENNGYPFASIRLDSLEISESYIDASVLIEKGPLILFDSLQITGNTKTTQRFLSRYLQIYPGQLYDQQKIKNVQRLLQQLPYLEITQAPMVQFGRDKARLYLFLKDKKSNQFDGIVGFLPDPNGKEKKLLVTGEVNLDVRNLKGSGKALGLHWRKVQRGSQLLDASYLHPNLLGSPIELGFTFNLYKQDTAFVTLKPRLQFGFNTSRAGKITFFTELQNSRLLLSRVGLQDRRDSIPLADFNYNAYGMQYLRQNLDDVYFPRKGYLVSGQIAIGNKNIKRNLNQEASYYDTIQLKTTQISLGVH